MSLIETGNEHIWLERPEPAPYGPGTVGVIPAGVEHASFTTGHPVSFHNVHLDRDAFAEQLAELGHRGGPPRPGLFFGAQGLRQAMGGLRRELTPAVGGFGQGVLVDAFALQLTVLLARQLGHLAAHRPPAARLPARARLERAAETMRLHPEHPHPLAQLADLAGMTPWHFVRQFKRVFGAPPHTYLRSLRLERARALVLETSLPLTVIAADLGFGSSSRLSEGFRARFGCSPSSLRA